MCDRTLPFDECDLLIGYMLDQHFRRTGSEVGNHVIDGDPPPLNHDAGLAGGDEGGVESDLAGGSREFECGDHLADVAIGANGEHSLAMQMACSAAGDAIYWAGIANVMNLRTTCRGCFSKLSICRQIGV